MHTEAYLLKEKKKKSSSIKVSHPADSKLPQQLVTVFVSIAASFVILLEDVI